MSVSMRTHLNVIGVTACVAVSYAQDFDTEVPEKAKPDLVYDVLLSSKRELRFPCCSYGIKNL